VEHYEMAGYGSARGFAKLLAQKEVAALLEEKNADKTLTGASLQDAMTAQNRCLANSR
jgi:ferritin-like metal-binding protein YciE